VDLWSQECGHHFPTGKKCFQRVSETVEIAKILRRKKFLNSCLFETSKTNFSFCSIIKHLIFWLRSQKQKKVPLKRNGANQELGIALF
jgi:hypothetical protein